MQRMKKIVILLLMLTPLKNFAVEFFNGTYAQALQKCKEENKLLLLDFTAVWCGPCHTMEIEVLNDPDVSKYLDEKFVVLKLDLDEPDTYYYREKFSVNGIPDYTIVNFEGNQLAKHLGSCSKKELLVFFNSIEKSKRLTIEQIDEKLNELKKIYDEKPNAQSLYVYLNFLLKYKQDGALAVKIYKDATAIKKNNIIQIPKLLAHYFAQNNDENSFKNLVDFMSEKGVGQSLISARALAFYEFYIAKNDINQARKYLDEYLDMLTEDKSWEDVGVRIIRIKNFTYTYKQYSWGVKALEKLKDNYAGAYANKKRLPITGHLYQLALMNYLDGNCANTQQNIIEYKKYQSGFNHLSAYNTENEKMMERMTGCNEKTK